MTQRHHEGPGRRDFLKFATVGAASLAAGGLSDSAFGKEGKKRVNTKTTDAPTATKVELLFLGTGAADWPSTYPPKTEMLAKGQVRGMSSMLLNGHILIDSGPTVLAAMDRYDVNPSAITDILLTHTHADHLHEETIGAIADARDATLGPLKFWADPEALKRVPKSTRIEQRAVEVGRSFTIHGFGITGLASNHLVEDSEETCLIYLVEGAEKSFLYATDGGWLLNTTWDYLKKKKLDAIIWDATIGEKTGDYRIFGHNDIAMIRHMNRTLLNTGVLKPDATIILTHLARTLHPSHAQLESMLSKEGLVPAYDGMSVTLKSSVAAPKRAAPNG